MCLLCIPWALVKEDALCHFFALCVCEILIKKNCECQLLSLSAVSLSSCLVFGTFDTGGQVLLSGNHGYAAFP